MRFEENPRVIIKTKRIWVQNMTKLVMLTGNDESAAAEIDQLVCQPDRQTKRVFRLRSAKSMEN